MPVLNRCACVLAAATLAAAPLAIAAPNPGQIFIRRAIEGNLAEIEAGKLAERDGASAGVRRLGRILERDHARADQQAMSVASAMGVAAPSMPSPRQQRAARRLASLSGRRFDQAFVKMQIKAHRQAIERYREAERGPTGPAESYAKATLPVLQRHLRLAQSLAHGAPRR